MVLQIGVRGRGGGGEQKERRAKKRDLINENENEGKRREISLRAIISSFSAIVKDIRSRINWPISLRGR